LCGGAPNLSAQKIWLFSRDPKSAYFPYSRLISTSEETHQIYDLKFMMDGCVHLGKACVVMEVLETEAAYKSRCADTMLIAG